MNSKKLFIIVLSILTVAFVSCSSKKNETTSPSPTNPDTPKLFKLSSIVGTWTNVSDNTDTLIVSPSGELTLKDQKIYTISSWDTKKEEEYLQFSEGFDSDIDGKKKSVSCEFSSDTCNLTIDGVKTTYKK